MADRDGEPRRERVTSHENQQSDEEGNFTGSAQDGINSEDAGQAVRALGNHDEERRNGDADADDEESELAVLKFVFMRFPFCYAVSEAAVHKLFSYHRRNLDSFNCA